MATYLLEDEDQFPAAADMVVPEAMDRWGGPQSASAGVRGVARTMLNRTAWLKKRIVKLAEDNSLTGVNTFRRPVVFTPSNVNEHMFGTAVTAQDAPNPNSNRWQLIGRLKASGGLYVHIYTGSDVAGRGAFAITVNASWDVNTNQWAKQQSNQQAVALIWRYGNLRIAARPANDNDPWATWATTWDNGGELQSESVQAGVVTLNQANFRQSTTRVVPIPLLNFRGAGRLEDDGYVSTVGGTTGQMPPAWQLTAPTGCRTGTITILHEQNQTGSDPADIFELWKRSSTTGPWSVVATKTATVGANPRATTLRDVAVAATGGETHVDGAEYLVVWKIGHSSGANNRVRSLQVERWEPGLRNS